MRVVVQRVQRAEVKIGGITKGAIRSGLLILLGIEENDTDEDVVWLCNKIAQMRIFSDSDGKMNLSVMDCKGELLVVSQFTLHASTKKGNRPSFISAARPEKAIPLYESFCTQLKSGSGLTVETGEFGADMQVELINDGPVTIIIDSKARE
ncbi:MAG TPA: D-aminoacyl-tRNA deacylase [Flavobacteriales bacterium]|nr:D-tyrosyl-tRNA(Tyr) deacylase [Flavobacteriales bacterium]HRE75004.1 D-aminoacyl-tRNA deacylase [Flavobacteriales bacterium]HRE95370.1 D-aminoacyl-tRNA deacylase [Flavobacteriales bacterium]HRJ34555.1 D-aminoacyl-tRNA deacylase [Flavobacteriales bacterium]HRJ38116.1 D-aminoacyl-tRNA deacylase [Flavobacteriales bacterium]